MTNTRKFWTLRYIIINATYFAVYSGIHAYASVFLLEKGFSNTLIGITLALANISANYENATCSRRNSQGAKKHGQDAEIRQRESIRVG